MVNSEDRVIAEAVKLLVEHYEDFLVYKRFEVKVPDVGSFFPVPIDIPMFSLDIEKLLEVESVRKAVDFLIKKDVPRLLRLDVECKESVEDLNCKYALIREFLKPLVDTYVERFGEIFSDERFAELYREVAEHIYKSYMDYVIVAPLDNFELEVPGEVKLGSYKLRELTRWEKEVLQPYSSILNSPPAYHEEEPKTPSHCVELVERVPKKSSQTIKVDVQLVEDFVTVLRIYKKGYIKASVILVYSRVLRRNAHVILKPHMRWYEPRAQRYVLRREELPDLNKLIAVYTKLKDQLPSNVRISFRWFNKSYEDIELVDRFLDLAIALETLYGTGDRLDIYVPKLIGTTREEMLKISKDMEELRRARGSIVHSGCYERLTRELVDTVEEYYRRSARKVLELLYEGKTHEEIVEEIKRSIFS